jgi:hypothetical protein
MHKKTTALVILTLLLAVADASAQAKRLLYLSFEEGVAAGRELPGAHYVEGKEGRAIMAAPGEKGALVLPATGNVDLAKGTVAFWFRPRELMMPMPRREETNLLVLDRSGEHLPGNPAKVKDKILNMFIAQVGSARVRGETFADPKGYYGAGVEYTKLYPEWYHFAWTWDSEAGTVAYYLNARLESAIPFVSRLSGKEAPLPATGLAEHFQPKPWTPQSGDGVLIVGNQYVAMDDVMIFDEALSADKVAELAGLSPGEGLTDEGVIEFDTTVDLDKVRGELLYSCDFDSEEDLEGWVMEGPGEAETRNGRLFMYPGEPRHIVYWCPEDFPGDVLIEYDFYPANETGLCIIFFCASGSEGRDLFDPTLEERVGNFGNYVRGDIECYHASYYRNGGAVTGVCNLRKDPGMPLLGVGIDPIPPVPGGPHHIAVWKEGERIRLIIDGQLVIDALDSDVFGPPHGAGKMGWRHMTPMRAYYDNLKVWSPR